MPRKIENPLVTGLPAKIFYQYYIQPNTRYGVSKKIYGRPLPEKISKWTKKMINDGYLKKFSKKDPNLVCVNLDPLIKEIKNELEQKNISINESDFYNKLKNLLNSKQFKTYLSGFYSRSKIEVVDYGGYTKTFPDDFSVLKAISETIGMISTMCYINKKFKKKKFEEDITELRKIYKKTNPNNWKNLLEGIENFNLVIPFFKKFKDDTIIKLTTLWPDSHMIIYSHYIECFEQMEKKK